METKPEHRQESKVHWMYDKKHCAMYAFSIQCSNEKDQMIQRIQNIGTKYDYHRAALATRKYIRQRMNAREFRAHPHTSD